MILYRPVGLRELELIAASGFEGFPPRLAHQPIFYPVLNFAYAEEIASGWNVKEPPHAGFVTEFDIDDEYVVQFPRQVVGSRRHEELWVPAEQLTEFNSRIRGPIRVVASYYGSQFQGDLDPVSNLPKHIAAQLP